MATLLVACASLRGRSETCFAESAASGAGAAERNQWVRLVGWPAADSGAADFGYAKEIAGTGRWRRLGADSVRVTGHGLFDALDLRALARGETLQGQAALTTDVLRDSGGVYVPSVHRAEWAGRRRSCQTLQARISDNAG
jgi:hypothetical protein